MRVAMKALFLCGALLLHAVVGLQSDHDTQQQQQPELLSPKPHPASLEPEAGETYRGDSGFVGHHVCILSGDESKESRYEVGILSILADGSKLKHHNSKQDPDIKTSSVKRYLRLVAKFVAENECSDVAIAAPAEKGHLVFTSPDNHPIHVPFSTLFTRLSKLPLVRKVYFATGPCNVHPAPKLALCSSSRLIAFRHKRRGPGWIQLPHHLETHDAHEEEELQTTTLTPLRRQILQLSEKPSDGKLAFAAVSSHLDRLGKKGVLHWVTLRDGSADLSNLPETTWTAGLPTVE